jgi:hypothetical protein
MEPVLYSIPVYVDGTGSCQYAGGVGGIRAWWWMGECPISAEAGTPHIGCEEQWYSLGANYEVEPPWWCTVEADALFAVVDYLFGEE